VPVITHDAALLAALHRSSFDEPWSEAFFASLLGQPGTMALTVADPAPLGFILVRVAADEAEILTLAVVPSARRAGRGRRLVEAALAALAASTARRCLLEVAADNAAAIALYAAGGFKPCGRRPGYYRRGQVAVDAVLMERAL
jgi:ribosomal-protein-alanine N-acetyltransferase